ncbi:hypothetical protein [Parenemella sanctibonifatiensis]|nr:hypothetical protein [Parenemella sanctibonifatiensis]
MLLQIPAASAAERHPYENTQTPAESVQESKEQDPKGFAERVELIQQSQALMALLQGLDSDARLQYVEFFASTVTTAQAKSFVESTEGKHFVVTGSAENPVVELVDGPAAGPQAMPTCAAGWAAAAAWFAGQMLLCSPLPVVGGFICNGVFFAIGLLPDFNAVCN